MTMGRIKNWAKFQHYKDRAPPWIKLERKLLDDYEFACLPIASKALAPFLWLLASESNDGEVRIDVDWLSYRLRWPATEVATGLSALIDKGFVIVASEMLATCLQDAFVEREREVEVEKASSFSDEKLEVPASGNPAAAEELQDGSNGPEIAERKRCPTAEIVALYHAELSDLPRVEKMTDARAGYIRQRWMQDLPTLDAWRNYFADVRRSKFLMGLAPGRDGKPPFRADLEWLIKPSNFAKVSEGKYHR